MRAGNLQWKIVDSSAVHAIAYSREEQAIYVEFPRGAVYRYKECTLSDYQDLEGAASIGGHIGILKTHHDYEQV